MSTRERGFTINGVARQLMVADEQTLAEMLREQLGLTGCKVGCDQAVCGACTVLVDGVPVTACACFAATVEGAAIETIEGPWPARAARSGATGVRRNRRGAMRLLHRRHDHVSACPAASRP